jgi:hypothetical protein
MSFKFLYQKSILLLVLTSCLFSQNNSSSSSSVFNTSYSMNGEKYHTSTDGMVYFYVNVWGHVKSPGRIRLVEGVDIITLLSAVGGPKNGANLKKVMLYREIPDQNKKFMYEINIDNFIDKGDRAGFVKILPNDTILVEETNTSFMMNRVGTLNTLMNLLNIYLNLSNK